MSLADIIPNYKGVMERAKEHRKEDAYGGNRSTSVIIQTGIHSLPVQVAMTFPNGMSNVHIMNLHSDGPRMTCGQALDYTTCQTSD